MKIRVVVSNTVPTRHNHRVLQPRIEVEDDLQAGESPLQAYRRLSVMANAMFARELLDQLRFTDRMQASNEAWCDEFLSTVTEDHPAMSVVTEAKLPPEVQAILSKVGDAIGKAAVEACEGLQQSDVVPQPQQG